MLEQLLKQTPSAEVWADIIEVGKPLLRAADARVSAVPLAAAYCAAVTATVKSWPPEIERKCPESWPEDFRKAVEHRPHETDLYSHFIAKLCAHPDLKLSDGSQAVWLERRFTGGVVDIGIVELAKGLLWGAIKDLNWAKVRDAINLLSGGVRRVGKIGCADLTGGVTIERKSQYSDEDGTYLGVLRQHEYRLEIEVKVGDAKQRPEQTARMNSVKRRGGCYIMARSVDEAVQQIKQFIENT